MPIDSATATSPLWVKNKVYIGGDHVCILVKHGNAWHSSLYKCKITHQGNDANQPPSTAYWEFIRVQTDYMQPALYCTSPEIICHYRRPVVGHCRGRLVRVVSQPKALVKIHASLIGYHVKLLSRRTWRRVGGREGWGRGIVSQGSSSSSTSSSSPVSRRKESMAEVRDTWDSAFVFGYAYQHRVWYIDNPSFLQAPSYKLTSLPGLVVLCSLQECVFASRLDGKETSSTPEVIWSSFREGK
ncbi:hypothetical protein BD626DRAFT_587644 [Schizophyllum amplum]|uniref:Uncharacterized protein n=1 Tax=Schizophyllum amplum TaxID=97359 RepID=A0A550BTN1_9AGAR|nr:hypothetical protein BD626DRAFT_587644 [Auriculariopsis ampla]